MKEKTKILLRRILMVLCVFVITVSGYKIASEFYTTYKTSSDNNQLVKNVVINNNNSTQIKDINIKFDKLFEVNKDTTGWLNIPNTPISYPIVHRPNDNSYYLHRAFDGRQIIYGSIFLDGSNNPTFEDNVTYIYGHNIDTGTTLGSNLYFSNLKDYQDEKYLKEHNEIQVFTPKGDKYSYKVIGLSVEKATTDLYKLKFNSIDEYESYLKTIENKFNLEKNTLTKDNKIVVLCTCEDPVPNDPNRRLLFAYR